MAALRPNSAILHLSFNGLPPTHHPKKNIDHLQSYTEAGMTLRRSQTYSLEWIENEFKKEKFGLKAHYYGKAQNFMKKILRGEVFIDTKRIKFMEHKKFKALPKITGQDS